MTVKVYVVLLHHWRHGITESEVHLFGVGCIILQYAVCTSDPLFPNTALLCVLEEDSTVQKQTGSFIYLVFSFPGLKMWRHSTRVHSVLSRIGCADQGPCLITHNPIGHLIDTRQRKRHTSGREECIRMETKRPQLPDRNSKGINFGLSLLSCGGFAVSGIISTNQIVLFLNLYILFIIY